MTDPQKWQISDAALRVRVAVTNANAANHNALAANRAAEDAAEAVKREQIAFRKVCDQLLCP